MKTAIDVEIMGQRLRVTSDDGEEHLRRVVDYLNDRMREMAAGSGSTAAEAAILAALNIASEYWKLRQEQEEISQAIDRLSRRLVGHLSA